MASFNSVVIMGNLTKDPEVKQIGDSSCCNFSVAVNKKYRNKAGESVESVSFIECSAWGKTAESLQKYQKKGSPILVSGELHQQTWTDKESGKKRSKLSVRAHIIQFLGGRDASQDNESVIGNTNGAEFETPDTEDVGF